MAAKSNHDKLVALLLGLQHQEAQRHLRWSSKGHLDKAARREDARSLLETSRSRTSAGGDGGVSVQELVQAFGPSGKPLLDPLSEPYLQLTLGRLQADKLAKLKAGEVPLPDSYNLVILPDFTGSACRSPTRATFIRCNTHTRQ